MKEEWHLIGAVSFAFSISSLCVSGSPVGQAGLHGGTEPVTIDGQQS